MKQLEINPDYSPEISFPLKQCKSGLFQGELLNRCPAVVSYEIQDYKQGTDFYYLKVRCELKNDTLLYIRQYVSAEEYNYSYHWQNRNGELIVRWDNAPHHETIITFPHHKHIGGKVTISYEISIEDVLNYITKVFSL